jgi:hypothetical protein
MEIKIDPNDYASLKVLKGQLSQALEVVDFALKAHNKRNAPAPILRNGNGHDDQQADALMAQIIPTLPQSFTTAAVSRLDAVSDMSREGINAALERAAIAGKLKLILKAAGRRPAKYQKVN